MSWPQGASSSSNYPVASTSGQAFIFQVCHAINKQTKVLFGFLKNVILNNKLAVLGKSRILVQQKTASVDKGKSTKCRVLPAH